VNVSLFQAAAAMTANARWQDVISGNLAATTVPGYKRQEVSFSAIEAGQAAGAANYSLPQAKAVTSFRQGELRPTSVPTDVALEGKGFFSVRLPNGAEGYTRDGEFHVNSLGEMVTKQGYQVMGDSGPIQLDRNSAAPLTISADGEVRQGSEMKGKLKVTEFNNPQLLTDAGSGCYLANDPALAGQPATTPQVRQAYLENSNTTSVLEMASLISAMRAFEASQRVIQAQDDRMGKAIQEIANPN
jgi:flagellar basal-body rod protein FlgF